MEKRSLEKIIKERTEYVADPSLVKKPLLSVLVWTYNHAAFIHETIDNILNQKTNFDYEIIISDDCSTDGTTDIVRRYQQEFPDRIKLLISRKNIFSINGAIGIRSFNQVRGKYVAFVEGDDYWTNNNKLQKQIDFLESNPEFSMSAHKAETIDQTKNEKALSGNFGEFPGGVFTTKDILTHHFIPTLSLVFRKSALNLPDWYLRVRSGDIAQELIISLAGKGMFFNDSMGVYRQHDGGITKKIVDHDKIYRQDYCLYRNFQKMTGNRFIGLINKRLCIIDLGYFGCKLKSRQWVTAISALLRAWKKCPKYVTFDFFLSLLNLKTKKMFPGK
jgi:glycosyltransferase involved in cell wall biosynthesis